MRASARGSAHARGSERGQAAVETLGLLPLIALVALSLAQLLATGAAHSAASSAAEAAALALLQHTGDPARAARAAAPAWSRSRMSVRVDGRSVVVAIRPRTFVPGTTRLLTATASASS
jgi:Flp pilus assembly protein TadG